MYKNKINKDNARWAHQDKNDEIFINFRTQKKKCEKQVVMLTILN